MYLLHHLIELSHLAPGITCFVRVGVGCESETNSMDGAAAFPVVFQREKQQQLQWGHPNGLGSAFSLVRAMGDGQAMALAEFVMIM